MKNQFEELKKIFGSHIAAAAALGVTRRTYLNYRKGNVPKPIAKLIQSTLDQHRITPGNQDIATVDQAVNG